MKYLSIKDLQDVLGLSHNTVYKLVKTEGFPSVKIGGKYLVEESDLKKYIDQYIGKEIFTS